MSKMHRYKIFLTKKAKKMLDSLDKEVKQHILDRLIILRDCGFTRELDIKKLQGYGNYYRLRVGRYRVLFELVKPNTLIVFAILPREKAYK